MQVHSLYILKGSPISTKKIASPGHILLHLVVCGPYSTISIIMQVIGKTCFSRCHNNLCVLFVQVHQLDLPVRHNQVLIIKHFSIMREKVDFCKEFLGERKEKKCLELLHEKVCTDISCYFQYHTYMRLRNLCI